MNFETTTRDGRKARVICWDRRDGCEHPRPVVALVEEGGWERTVFYPRSGRMADEGFAGGKDSAADIMGLPDELDRRLSWARTKDETTDEEIDRKAILGLKAALASEQEVAQALGEDNTALRARTALLEAQMQDMTLRLVRAYGYIDHSIEMHTTDIEGLVGPLGYDRRVSRKIPEAEPDQEDLREWMKTT